MEFATEDGKFEITLRPEGASREDGHPRFWRITVRFDGVAFGEEGPNLIWPDLTGLSSLWTATDRRLDPEASTPEGILMTILGDDAVNDATLPNLGESFDHRGPIRRFRWKNDVVWLFNDTSAGGGSSVQLARVPVDGYLAVVSRAFDYYLSIEN